jgi:hypothetical protein
VLSDPRYSVLRERPLGRIPVTSFLLRFGAGEDRSPVRATAMACFVVTLVCAVQPLENSKASTSIFVLQATKSQRWMPWRLKPKKDVGDCEKPRGAVYLATIRGYPNGATQHLS